MPLKSDLVDEALMCCPLPIVDTDFNSIVFRMPISDPQELIRITGERTNARVCRDSLEVVNVLPFPDPMTVWAPEELCQPVE